jgi:hypothetical protein
MTKHSKKYHGPRIFGQWVPHQVMMIGILRGLSLTARRVLDTLEIENSRHFGKENGNLLCTYTDFNRFVTRRCIRKALDELIAAGLIEITRLGRRSYADLRNPSLYRLTYLHTFKNGQWVSPTHEWKKRKTGAESTTGAGAESTTGNPQKPGLNQPPQGGQSQGCIDHSLIDTREAGWGLGGVEVQSSNLSLSSQPQGGAGLNAPPLPHSGCCCLATAPHSAVGGVASSSITFLSSANGRAAALSNGAVS